MPRPRFEWPSSWHSCSQPSCSRRWHFPWPPRRRRRSWPNSGRRSIWCSCPGCRHYSRLAPLKILIILVVGVRQAALGRRNGVYPLFFSVVVRRGRSRRVVIDLVRRRVGVVANLDVAVDLRRQALFVLIHVVVVILLQIVELDLAGLQGVGDRVVARLGRLAALLVKSRLAWAIAVCSVTKAPSSLCTKQSSGPFSAAQSCNSRLATVSARALSCADHRVPTASARQVSRDRRVVRVRQRRHHAPVARCLILTLRSRYTASRPRSGRMPRPPFEWPGSWYSSSRRWCSGTQYLPWPPCSGSRPWRSWPSQAHWVLWSGRRHYTRFAPTARSDYTGCRRRRGCSGAGCRRRSCRTYTGRRPPAGRCRTSSGGSGRRKGISPISAISSHFVSIMGLIPFSSLFFPFRPPKSVPGEKNRQTTNLPLQES